MQYILTQEEYNAFKVDKQPASRLPSIDALQDFCTYVADNLPIQFWNRTKATPWGCIRSTQEEWYCDECPARAICPADKSWSK